MAAAAVSMSKPSQPSQGSQKLSLLERIPNDSWAKIAACVGEKFALCRSINKRINETLSALGSSLWYEHCLLHYGARPKGQEWQVHFMRSGLSLQMGMKAKLPSIRETGYIRACVLEGRELALAKMKNDDVHGVVSEITWSNLATGATEACLFKEEIHSLSFQRGVFAAVGEEAGTQRLHIWRQGKGPGSLRSLDLKAHWLPKESIYCRIGHGNVLLSGWGPEGGVGLALLDLATGETILPFGRSSDISDTNMICGAYGNRTLFMDPHTVLTAQLYIAGRGNESQKLHVWDVRVGFDKNPAQSYPLEEPFCRDFTLNWRGEICTATTNQQNGTGSSLLSLWDMRTSKCIRKIAPKGDMAISTLSSMGGVIFSGSNNGVVRCWNSQLESMGKWVMPNSAQTTVPQIALSPSKCVFLTQEIAPGARVRGMSFMHPTTVWQAESLPFEPARANAAAAPAAPSPMAAAGAGAAAAASR